MGFKLFHSDAAEYLKQELQLRMQSRHSYSLRKFASDLEMSPGTLVDFLKGRLGFSKARAEFVAHEIKLSPEQKEHFWNLLLAQFSRSQDTRTLAKKRVAERLDAQKPSPHAEITAHWYHMAILELIDLDETMAMPHRLAPILGITTEEARKALDRLYKVGMIKNSLGRPEVNENIGVVQENLPMQALRQVQTQFLNLAQKAIDSQRPLERENFAAFVTIDKADLPEIKLKLRRAFFQVIEPHLSTDQRNSVFCFGMQMFKLYEADVEKALSEDFDLQNMSI